MKRLITVAAVAACLSVTGLTPLLAQDADPPRRFKPAPETGRASSLAAIEAAQEKNTFPTDVMLDYTATTLVKRDGSTRTMHYQARFDLPGTMRLDFIDAPHFIAVWNERSETIFKQNGDKQVKPRHQPFMATLLDIMVMEPEKWIEQARTNRINTDLYCEVEWEGRHYLVIGSINGEPTHPQVWIDKETLLPTRAITASGSRKFLDWRVKKFEIFEDGSVFPKEIEVQEDGQVVKYDEFSGFQTGVEFNTATFDPDAIQRELREKSKTTGVG